MRTRVLRVFALLGAVLLMAGTVGFAGAASAAPGNGNATAHAPQTNPPAESTRAPTVGNHAKARPHTRTAKGGGSVPKAATSTSGGGPDGGRSGVSLPKPNHYQAQADPDGMQNGGVDQPGGSGGMTTSTQDGNNGSGNDVDCEDDNRGQGVPGHCKPRPDGCAQHGHGKGHAHGNATQCEAAEAPGTPEVADTAGAAGSPTSGSADALSLGTLGSKGFLPAGSAGMPAQGTVAEVLGAEAFAPVAGASATYSAPKVAAATGATLGGSWRTPTVAGVQASVGPKAGLLPNTGAGKALLAVTAFGMIALAGGGALLLRRHRLGASG